MQSRCLLHFAFGLFQCQLTVNHSTTLTPQQSQNTMKALSPS
uniref:Uncharacterized protein n=1 Tax=Tetranychus urticae TaxID=32264 RepID=T1KES0_TETUR